MKSTAANHPERTYQSEERQATAAQGNDRSAIPGFITGRVVDQLKTVAVRKRQANVGRRAVNLRRCDLGSRQQGVCPDFGIERRGKAKMLSVILVSRGNPLA